MRRSDLIDTLTENGMEDAFFIDNPDFDAAIIGFDIAEPGLCIRLISL